MLKIKNKIFDIIDPDNSNSVLSRIFDASIITLIIISVLSIILDTFEFLGQYSDLLYIIEIFTIIIFTVEYILRIWTADMLYPDFGHKKARFLYIISFMALIDLFAILPFYLPFFLPHDLIVIRSLRIIRIFRFFKFNRYTNVLSDIGEVFKKKASQLITSTFIVFLLMLITSILMFTVEHEKQPDVFKNAFDSLWYTIATITTIGYGDIYPISVWGKALSGVIAFLGIGLVAIPTGIISAGFIEQAKRVSEEKEADKKCFCPYCGKKLD